MARLWGGLKKLAQIAIGTTVKVGKHSPIGQQIMGGYAIAKTVQRGVSDPKSAIVPPERFDQSFHVDGDVLIKHPTGDSYVWVSSGDGGNWVHHSAIEFEG